MLHQPEMTIEDEQYLRLMNAKQANAETMCRR
jgi:hypothetical protein